MWKSKNNIQRALYDNKFNKSIRDVFTGQSNNFKGAFRENS